jgi:hypothetical protein
MQKKASKIKRSTLVETLRCNLETLQLANRVMRDQGLKPFALAERRTGTLLARLG